MSMRKRFSAKEIHAKCSCKVASGHGHPEHLEPETPASPPFLTECPFCHVSYFEVICFR